MLHFVGHGGFDATAGEGVLALTDDTGRSAVLGATEFGRLLADHQSLRLVVLNSCLGAKASGADVFSSTSSVLVRRGVPAVLAMQYQISDQAALEFSRSFYEAVADGMPIDAAVADARKAVSLSARNSVEWATPVLHMRSPDGVLFRIERPPSAVVADAARPSRAPAAAAAAPVTPAPVPVCNRAPSRDRTRWRRAAGRGFRSCSDGAQGAGGRAIRGTNACRARRDSPRAFGLAANGDAQPAAGHRTLPDRVRSGIRARPDERRRADRSPASSGSPMR